MKIYFDGIIYSWQTGGGVYRYIEEIIDGCKKDKDIEAILLMHLPVHNTSTKEGILIKNTTPIRYRFNFGFKLLRKLFSPINKILLEKYFKNISTGIFHSTYYSTYKNIKIPQVLTVHDMTYEKFPTFFNSAGAKRFITNKKKCITAATSIISVSEATKKALIDIYKIDSEKIQTVYHGLSRAFITEANQYNNDLLDKPYFLFVGNRRLYKNFDFMIEAFAKWKYNKEYNIVLMGGGRLSKEENKLINNLNLSNQIKHLGFVEEKYLKSIYQKSQSLIFPSLDEGFGFPILEAICSGTQVIASDIEVFKEIGENMLIYFNPQKSESLVEALNQCVQNKPTKEEFERRIKYVINKFSWTKCINDTIKIYKQINNEKFN